MPRSPPGIRLQDPERETRTGEGTAARFRDKCAEPCSTAVLQSSCLPACHLYPFAVSPSGPRLPGVRSHPLEPTKTSSRHLPVFLFDRQGTRHCQITKRRRSPRWAMDQLPPMSTSVHEALSPSPQPERDEMASPTEIDLDSAAETAQPVRQANHHTLSTRASKGGTSGPEHTAPRSEPAIMSFSVAISPPIDAQPRLQPGPGIAQDMGSKTVDLENGASSLSCSPWPRKPEIPVRMQLVPERHQVDSRCAVAIQHSLPALSLLDLPTEVLLQILGNLEVCDLLAASRVRSSVVSYPLWTSLLHCCIHPRGSITHQLGRRVVTAA